MTDTPVSRSLGATFSELTGQTTPLELRDPIPTTIAPMTGTTETIPSSVALFEPVTSVVSATAIVADVAPLPTVILPESQAVSVPEQTQTASPSLPAIEGQTAQSSGSSLYSHYYGLHSDSKFFSASDGHSSL